MKIQALRLFNVKRFADEGVAIEGIGDGVNVLTAANEFGKSTSFEALHALFFQPHTSAAKDVKELRPYSGGSPVVEADIETKEGRFLLRKQFFAGKFAKVLDRDTGRLVAQADEAESFIAGLIRGGSAGPAGLLWVRQGITGLEERSRKDEDGERRVRESLLTSVQGEVEAITGGRRMKEIIDACEEELGRLVTPTGRPKAGGSYDEVLKERQHLEVQEHDLRAAVEALRDALEERRRRHNRLAELEHAEESTARRAQVVEAEKEFDTAKAHGAALSLAESEAKVARGEREAAKRDLDAYRAAAERSRTLAEELRKAEQQRSEALARRDRAVATVEKATAGVQSAETEEEEARALLARLDAALAARHEAEKLSKLRHDLERAEAARATLEDGEAALAVIAVPERSVDELQRLEVEIARLRATEEAGLPTLRMAYVPGAAAAVSMDGEPLADAQERPFRDVARIDIPRIGALTLRSNRAIDTGGTLAKEEKRRRDLLAAIGVADLAAARQRQEEARAKSAALDRLRQEIAHLAPDGLDRLREAVAHGSAISSELLELKGDPEQARVDAARAAQKMHDARNGLRELQPSRTRADEALMEARTGCVALEKELEGVNAALGPEVERATRDATLAATLAEAQALFDAREAHAAELRANAPDLASAQARLNRARSVEDAARQEAGQLRERLAELNGEIRTRSDEAVEEAWREAQEALAAKTARAEAYETEAKVLTHLRDALQASRSAARDLYLEPVIKELHPLLGLLFDDVSVVFDEKTLLPQTIRRNGQDEDVERLSGGMREQLSVLTRLAFARLLARDGRPAPVILDDALVYSDDDRIERMFDALHRQSQDQQIIVFSCRQRAFARLGGTVLQMTAWRPDAA